MKALLILNVVIHSVAAFIIFGIAFAGVYFTELKDLLLGVILLGFLVGVVSGIFSKAFAIRDLLISTSPLLLISLLFIRGALEKGGPVIVWQAMLIPTCLLACEGLPWFLISRWARQSKKREA